MHCRCGRPHAEGSCEPVSAPVADAAGQPTDFIEAALVKALLPHEGQRRRFLAAVGSQAARAAIASVLPVSALQAMAQDKAPLEKKDLQIGFIAITCATPLIMAHPMGFYQQQGLRVQLNKTAGWALIRDKIISGEHDASHFLSPMPLAMSMGVGSARLPVSVATIQNVNGQAITLHVKHKDKRDPRQWKGMKFAVPFEYSMHNFLLRYYVAEHGLDPDRDLQIRVTPPPEMVANLRAGNIDGFLGPDPFNQRAVYDGSGFIHLLSKDIWDGHPCCAFGLSEDFIRQHPNTFAALYRAVLKSAQMARDPAQREEIARAIAPAAYLNQPEVVIKQVLTGRFADGLGNVRHVPDRTDFDPVPWQAMAVWILTQMKRWGYLKGEVNYRQIAEKVFLLTDARRQMKLLEQADPGERGRTITVMGRGFDPARAQEYEKSFAIRKAAV
ncbi:CmpA/NrtA family ABC transporter substrate-binding protein [Eleftheria terrae]|uniref:CmpA/NrtA family ABC transporter substrate-binding protein n=1 Tax=Eleftheria terrae TaxID=1597781 RepID=UPI00263A690B|nr:CmpA/NrtA family ABC transporter substrate-binding protein [Eleftheria terrae]WKB55244.1 ABC transporter substrate-binding protein [Eleftheria terrae]